MGHARFRGAKVGIGSSNKIIDVAADEEAAIHEVSRRKFVEGRNRREMLEARRVERAKAKITLPKLAWMDR